MPFQGLLWELTWMCAYKGKDGTCFSVRCWAIDTGWYGAQVKQVWCTDACAQACSVTLIRENFISLFKVCIVAMTPGFSGLKRSELDPDCSLQWTFWIIFWVSLSCFCMIRLVCQTHFPGPTVWWAWYWISHTQFSPCLLVILESRKLRAVGEYVCSFTWI